MDKEQAIHKFWSSFGLTAYDENTVPDNAQMPYITYGVSVGALDDTIVLSGSLWYHSTSWKEITNKSKEIARTVGETGYYIDKIEGGYLFITRGSPFLQRMSDNNDTRRIYVVLNAEFITAF